MNNSITVGGVVGTLGTTISTDDRKAELRAGWPCPTCGIIYQSATSGDCDNCKARKQAESDLALARAECAAWVEWHAHGRLHPNMQGEPFRDWQASCPAGSGGQAFLDRLRKAEAWVAEYDGRARLATTIIEGFKAERDHLREENERLKAVSMLIVEVPGPLSEISKRQIQEGIGKATGRNVLVLSDGIKIGSLSMTARPDAPRYCGSHGRPLPCGVCDAGHAPFCRRCNVKISPFARHKCTPESYAKPEPPLVIGGFTKHADECPPLWVRIFVPAAFLVLLSAVIIPIDTLRGWFSAAWAWFNEVLP